MMYLTEQKTERLNKLSKKDLMIMLEPYTDDSLICIGLQMQQGYVGFYDLEQDTKHKNKYVFVLNSDCFNEWYKKDITELKEKIVEQQATIQRMKHSLNTIYKAFEKHYGYDMRNAVWLIDELNYDEIADELHIAETNRV